MILKPSPSAEPHGSGAIALRVWTESENNASSQQNPEMPDI